MNAAPRHWIERIATWPWPWPAVLVWLACWGWFMVLRGVGMPLGWALLLASALGVLAAFWTHSPWRRCFMALGFPLAWVFSTGLHEVPAWFWLLPAGVVVVLYPISTWRDAPLYPTPIDAFDGLRELLPLAPAARVLDAGCGLGHGLRALERAYPDARLEGVERSWPLRWACALRTPGARIFQGDMWQVDWSGYDMVYLFQRPETMPRADEHAQRCLAHGAWLASLEFPVPDRTPTLRWTCPDGRTLWLYQQQGPPTSTQGIAQTVP